MNVSVILPAAGLGTRMSAATSGTSRKQFMLLEGSPILVHTVRKFASCDLVSRIVVAVRRDDIEWVTELLDRESLAKPVQVVQGGNSRQESVDNALAAIDPSTDIVVVHDAVRPFVELQIIERVIHEAAETGAAIVGVVPVDTVKRVTRAQNGRARVAATIPRDRLVLAQTPQVFRYDLLRRAFETARLDGFTGTDEASLVERLEVDVTVISGSDRNLKITKPGDMELARLFLSQETSRA